MKTAINHKSYKQARCFSAYIPAIDKWHKLAATSRHRTNESDPLGARVSLLNSGSHRPIATVGRRDPHSDVYLFCPSFVSTTLWVPLFLTNRGRRLYDNPSPGVSCFSDCSLTCLRTITWHFITIAKGTSVWTALISCLQIAKKYIHKKLPTANATRC